MTRLTRFVFSLQINCARKKTLTQKNCQEPLWHFNDMLGPAVCWVQSVRRNVSVLDLVKDPAPAEFQARSGLAHRGALQMASLSDPKKFSEYFVSLMESGDLWWSENYMQAMASGGVNVTKFCSVSVENDSATFELLAPYRAKPLVFR